MSSGMSADAALNSSVVALAPQGEVRMPKAKTKPVAVPEMESTDVGGNKMEAVRRALHTLGRDARPTELHAHILREYNLDIKPNMISSYKSMILKGVGATGRQRGRRAADESDSANGNATVGISIKDLKAVKELARRLTARRVREILDLLE